MRNAKDLLMLLEEFDISDDSNNLDQKLKEIGIKDDYYETEYEFIDVENSEDEELKDKVVGLSTQGNGYTLKVEIFNDEPSEYDKGITPSFAIKVLINDPNRVDVGELESDITDLEFKLEELGVGIAPVEAYPHYPRSNK